MSKRMKRAWRMEVVWEDSRLLLEGWTLVADVLKQIHARKLVHTVGFVLRDDKQGVTLAAGVDGGRVSGATHIPASQIRKRRRLR